MTLQQEAPPQPVEAVPSRPTRGPNRTWRFLQVTHRWFSLITGIVLLLIILSGAILVLAPEIDEWTQPELYRSTPSERILTPEQAVASLKRAEPDFVPGDVVRQRGIYEIYDLEYVKSAYVDPGTGRVERHRRPPVGRDGLPAQPAPVRAQLRGLPGLHPVPGQAGAGARQRGADRRRPDPRRRPG